MQKIVLFKAFALTGLVFIIGLIVGILWDNQRLEETREKLNKMDIDWNDARLQSMYYQALVSDPDFCESAIKSNNDFADRIYQQGLLLERYENINKFTPSLLREKQRYTLLQLQFWMNAVNLRKTCNANYSTVVYFYSHMDESKVIDQRVQSTVLMDLLEKCRPNLITIPIPIDINVSTVDTLSSVYDIKKVPSLLVNETIVLPGVQKVEDVKEYINC